MWKIILNVVLLGLPYAWKFIQKKWGNKINDDVEEIIDDVVEAVSDQDETDVIAVKRD